MPLAVLRGEERKRPALDSASSPSSALASFQIGPEGAGPKTPALHGLWIDPITKIFCSEQWRPRKCDQGIRPPADRSLIAVLDEL